MKGIEKIKGKKRITGMPDDKAQSPNQCQIQIAIISV
jgi:hypothetical protein